MPPLGWCTRPGSYRPIEWIRYIFRWPVARTHARGRRERERERTAMIHPSSDRQRFRDMCVFVNANWKAFQERREKRDGENEEREKFSRENRNRIVVPLRTARSYTERSRLLCIAARSVRRRMPSCAAFFVVFEDNECNAYFRH